MKLLLSGEMTIKEVNKNFHRHFPYLKLEFYNDDPIPGQLSFWNDKLDENTRLSTIAENLISTAIEFDPTDTVSEFEQIIQKQSGLFVRVYRNIKGVWQETQQSSGLALAKQNALGNLSFKDNYNKHTLFL